MSYIDYSLKFPNQQVADQLLFVKRMERVNVGFPPEEVLVPQYLAIDVIGTKTIVTLSPDKLSVVGTRVLDGWFVNVRVEEPRAELAAFEYTPEAGEWMRSWA